MADTRQKPFMQPGWTPIEGGYGGGGRGSYSRPAQRTWGLQPYRSVSNRPAPVNVPSLDWSSQVFGRLGAVIAAVAGTVGAMTATGLFHPGSQLMHSPVDVGWQPRGLGDVETSHNGWDALIIPDEEEYVPRAVPLSPNAPSADPGFSRPVLDASGHGATSSAPVHAVSNGNTANAGDPAGVQSQIDAATSAWTKRVTEHEARMADFQNRNDAWVARELAEREAQFWREQEAAQNAYLAQLRLSLEQQQSRQPSVSIGFAPQPGGAVAVRTRIREAYDFKLTVPRKKDTKVRPAIYGVVNALISATYGTYSEIVDALEALAWNVYVLDKRGRPVQAMVVYNRNMAYVLRQVYDGYAKVDMQGFALDFTVNQWSDAMYAFQSRKMDEVALSLGWNAPVGITSYAQKGFQKGQNDVSSEWIRSSSRFIRSLDHGRAARVQSLWRLPRSSE